MIIMKQPEVVMIGLGYIGLPTAALIASNNVKVHGVDINPKVVETINRGEIHIVEPALDVAVASAVKKGYLKAATTPVEANTYIIVVPTPFKGKNEPDISFVEAATKAVMPLLKDGDFDGIRNMVEKAMRAGMDKNMGHEYNKDVESRYRENYRPTVPTPWPLMNDGIQGGWGPGDLVIVFGNPGGGKSWMMVAIAAHAVQMGFNTIYYTLELGEDYVGKRFDCYLTGYNIDEVNQYRDKVEEVVSKLPGKLIVKEYAPKSASVSTIKSHIQKCTDMEFKPDLVIIDYVDYLRGPSKKFAERKDEIDDVFVGVKGLAKELKIPILTPSQVNRMGAKDSVIEGDKAAGSYDKIMVADICLSLSRMKEDKVNGTGRIHVMKNRYGIDGMTYNAKVDTNNGHIDISEDIIAPESLVVEPTTVQGIDSLDRKALANKFFELQAKDPS